MSFSNSWCRLCPIFVVSFLDLPQLLVALAVRRGVEVSHESPLAVMHVDVLSALRQLLHPQHHHRKSQVRAIMCVVVLCAVPPTRVSFCKLFSAICSSVSEPLLPQMCVWESSMIANWREPMVVDHVPLKEFSPSPLFSKPCHFWTTCTVFTLQVLKLPMPLIPSMLVCSHNHCHIAIIFHSSSHIPLFTSIIRELRRTEEFVYEVFLFMLNAKDNTLLILKNTLMCPSSYTRNDLMNKI